MTEYINRRLSSFTLTPEAPQRTFRITALVAPTSKESPTPNLTFKKPPFLGTIRETVTFDIEHDKLPPSFRCSCLGNGNICKAPWFQEHYVVDWAAGSTLAKKEQIVHGIKMVAVKKGTLRQYVGWCAGGVGLEISETETLYSIDGIWEKIQKVPDPPEGFIEGSYRASLAGDNE
ncbi:hypothetical protein L13192_04589 [Pyrenophora tritici-repentis]|nr:hypothetical protein L13192_04589 [Pyrenophora tritici-repentis]